MPNNQIQIRNSSRKGQPKLFYSDRLRVRWLNGRGTARAADAQGTPTQSHISLSILLYEDKPCHEEDTAGVQTHQFTLVVQQSVCHVHFRNIVDRLMVGWSWLGVRKDGSSQNRPRVVYHQVYFSTRRLAAVGNCCWACFW